MNGIRSRTGLALIRCPRGRGRSMGLRCRFAGCRLTSDGRSRLNGYPITDSGGSLS
jgi:hypothetical protein